MREFLKDFFLSFIPLFVAMDVVAVIPLFLNLTDGLTENSRRELVTQATVTAFGIALVFLLLGNWLFSFLGITTSDFRIAGGIVLVVLAVTDLLFSQQDERRRPVGNIGVVPIGVPLIMGPAALTTILILVDSYGYGVTILSLVVNLAIVWASFRYSHWILRLIGTGGAKAIGKVASLFLAAIGVMMIRVGITAILSL